MGSLLGRRVPNSFARSMPPSSRSAAFRQHLRRGSTAIALAAIACGQLHDHAARGDSAERVAHIDSSGKREGVVAGAPAPAKSVSPAAESAAVLDQAYQAARSAINAEAYALDTLPVIARHSPDYARRFDALRHSTATDDSLRRARDRERALAAKGR
jgi:hypothetical protein